MINKVILVGNLGKDPEIKRFDNGGAVTKFPVATNENYKDKNGEWQTATEWHNVVVWGPAAERAEKDFRKGSMIYVEGKLTTRKWQDQQGVDKYITEVRAVITRRLEKREDSGFMPGQDDEFPPVAAPKKEASTQNSNQTPPAENSKPQAPAVDDDLPF